MTLEISHLSADELNLIFDSLSPLEARAAACVCRRWQQLVSPSRRRLLAVTSAGNNNHRRGMDHTNPLCPGHFA